MCTQNNRHITKRVHTNRTQNNHRITEMEDGKLKKKVLIFHYCGYVLFIILGDSWKLFAVVVLPKKGI